MHKLTRLEIGCLVATSLILMVMAFILANREHEKKALAGDPADEDQALPRLEAGATADASSTQPAEFANLARRMPNPHTPPAAPASSMPLRNEPASLAPDGTGVNGTNALMPAVSTVNTNDIMQELQRIAALPWTPAAEQQLQAVVAKWAATDPLGALQYANQIESRRVRSALLAGIFSTWAKSDINAASSWLLANRESNPTAFQAGLKPVFNLLATGNLDTAMRVAMEIPTGGDRMSALRIVVDQAVRTGVAPSMSAYLDSLQTPGEKRNYASILAQSWAVYDPQQAIQWAASLTDPFMRNASMNSAIGVWAADNPSAAAAYALAIQDNDLRSRQIAQVTQSWARYDPVRAADWLLSQHPPSPALDPAIQGLVGTVVQSNPEGAVMWAATISDPRLRTRSIISASREWMRSDPAKAGAYIAVAPLSPDQKARLLQGR